LIRRTRPLPEVSFIIPAFNEEQFLSTSLPSVRAQKGNFEIIVVDNNSRDGTAEFARRHADLVVPCTAQGIGAARNCGADRASGEILAFVDADAALAPEWLERGLRHLRTLTLDAVCGWSYFSERSIPRFCLYNTYSIGFTVFIAGRLATGRPVIAGNNLLIQKSTLLQAGGFPRLVGEDIKLSTMLGRQGCRIGFCSSMRIAYASRRFRRQGFFRVLRLWISTLKQDIPEAGYAIDYRPPTSRAGNVGNAE